VKKDPRQFDDKHLDFIRALPCVVCLDNVSVEAAHVRMSDRRAAKINAGVGQKPHDRWALPLCGKHHREQHGMNEGKFWDCVLIDPIFVALALYSVSGDMERGEMIIQAQH
jgi:hypothetical protein